MDKNYELKLLDKIFDVIECFTVKQPENSMADLQKKLNIHKATLYRILLNLENRGYLKKNTHTGKYRLGAIFLNLSSICLADFDLRTIARPFIQTLAAQTKETVIINIIQGYYGFCVERVNSTLPVKITADIGRRVPLLQGASGKILAAHCDEARLSMIYEQEKKNLSVTLEEISQQMRDIREKGYAVSFAELDSDTTGISFPIRKVGGEVVAGLSIIGPMFRIDSNTIPTLINFTKKCAEQISSEMGYKPT